NYHPARVKLLAQVFDFAQESLPVAPAQGGQRAGGQTQLVGDGDADAARAQVEREQTTMRGDGRICVYLVVSVWQSCLERGSSEYNASLWRRAKGSGFLATHTPLL